MPRDAAQDVSPTAPDARDAAQLETADTAAPGDALDAATTADRPIDVAPDVAIDSTPADGGPATDAAPDHGGGDATCGTLTDPRNCGACGNDCTALRNVLADKVECRDGSCFIPADGCAWGYGHCLGDTSHGCESDITQPGRCGCGVTCQPSALRCAVPAAGPPMCVASCDGTGLTACGLQCVDLQTNRNNCGACGSPCNLPNAIASSCAAGTCAVVRCEPGYADCDPSLPGCDTPLARFFDCRSCGDSCATEHASAFCGAAGCARTCHDGYGDCDRSHPDCETPLDTAANCGACGAACPNDRPLCDGARGKETCVSACAAPRADLCGTSCTDLMSDPRHCGNCATVCDSYQACTAGRCTPRYEKTDLFAAPSGSTLANSVVIAPDGSYYVSGYLTGPTDFNPGPAQEIHPSVTNLDAFIVKFNADGSYAWARTWPSGALIGVAVATDSSVFATGAFVGTVDFDPGAGVTRLTAQGVPDAVVLKLSAAGNLQWARAFAMTAEDAAAAEGSRLALGADGSIYATGAFRGQVDLDPGPGTNLHRTVSNDVFAGYVVKLTSAGLFTWGREISGSADSGAGPIAVDAAGTLWIGGYFGGTTDLDPGPGTDSRTAVGNTDGFLARWGSDGQYHDARVYSSGDWDSVDAISFDANGSVYVSSDSSDDAPPYATTGLVQKLDAGGALIWQQQRPSMFRATAVAGGGLLYMGGSEVDLSAQPMLITKLDGDGKWVWSIPAPNPIGFFGVAFAADATKLIIGGEVEGIGTVDLDPGAGTAFITAPGGAVTRYGF